MLEHNEERYGLSIIIPIYNVENYVDQCLCSCIINQDTNYDYEVILVDDGSTDRSGIIAKKWCEMNKHVRYVYQDNQGLGAARNTGIKHAEMSYVTFVDSDDWVADNFVECLMNSVNEGDYDIVYCDAYNYNSDNGMISRNPFRLNLQLINANYSQRMFFGYPNMWGAAYKRSVFIENNLLIPQVVYEDTAYYGVILDAFHNIGCCGKELYYYRTGRKGSLMNLNYMKTDVMIRALTILANEASKRGIFKSHYLDFLDFTIRQLQAEWNIAIRNEKTEITEKDINQFLEEYYPDWACFYMQKCAAIGSSNVCAIYNRVKMFREKIGDKYQFISFASFLSNPVPRDKVILNIDASDYRKAMIEKQIAGGLFEQIKDNDTIIFDLLEELHDLISVDDWYVNKTDAFDSAVSLLGHYNVIKYDSEERFIIWEKAVRAFAKWAKEGKKRVILMKYYLSSESGDVYTKRKYDNLELIEKKNKLLEKYYAFIEKECKDFKIVTLPTDFQYTDEKYAFGRSPEYFNSFANYILSYKTVKCWRDSHEF